MGNSTMKTWESVSYMCIYYTHILFKEQVPPPHTHTQRALLFKSEKKRLILNDNLVSVFEVTYECPLCYWLRKIFAHLKHCEIVKTLIVIVSLF